MNTDNQPLSIYVHIPFCTSMCTYCAFNTYTRLEHLIEPFVDALIAEIALLANTNPYECVHSVFFGGGTPSLLTAHHFERILDAIRSGFTVTQDAEITTEANPNDLNQDYLQGVRSTGVNRLSIGVQSADADELRLYARRHTVDEITASVQAARRAGFDNLNLDLIYGAPLQSLASWQNTLEQVLALEPEHISLYALGLETGTPMNDWVNAGKLPEPDDDLAADMYEYATNRLDRAGLVQYEISNWSQSGRECRHNLQYWRNWPYVGLGPGAHGFAGGVRYATVLAPKRYIDLVRNAVDGSFIFPRTPTTVDDVIVDREMEIAETLIMSLRLTQEGIVRSDFERRFGVDLVAYHRDVLERHQQHGLVEITPTTVRLTSQGRLLSNMVFRDLV